tara:strand:+ start:148 stop:306 length:159 start_codon:yes stop_codon:yes gene_type:complete
MVALPSGIVSFLFTGIEGSTWLWEEFPEAMHVIGALDELLHHFQIGHSPVLS